MHNKQLHNTVAHASSLTASIFSTLGLSKHLLTQQPTPAPSKAPATAAPINIDTVAIGLKVVIPIIHASPDPKAKPITEPTAAPMNI